MNDFAKPGLAEEKLPPVNASDNGKVLGVKDGVWDKVESGGGLKIFTIQEIDDEDETTYKANMPYYEWVDCDLFLYIDSAGQKFPLTPEYNAQFSLLSANPYNNPSIFLFFFKPDSEDDTGLTYTVSFFSADLVFTEED